MANPVTVINRPLFGRITVPPSKSLTHRALILSALSGGSVTHPARCDDKDATRRCLEAMTRGDTMDAGGSATTLRLLIPLSLLYGGGRFIADATLINRPLDVYERLGIRIARHGNQIAASGKLTGGEYLIDGGVSSQFISGLLIALPLVSGDSRIIVSKPVSAPYIQLTLDVMRAFGVEACVQDGAYVIPGGQRYRPCAYSVEGDWSYAANFIAANALGGNVELAGLSQESAQGDRAITGLIGREAADVAGTPDLLPILMAAACAKHCDTVLYNTGRLKYKESDRPQITAAQLARLGAEITVAENSVTVHGHGGLYGGSVESSDHRVIMALAIAAAVCDSPVTICGGESTAKSAPQFFSDIGLLGGLALA